MKIKAIQSWEVPVNKKLRRTTWKDLRFENIAECRGFEEFASVSRRFRHKPSIPLGLENIRVDDGVIVY